MYVSEITEQNCSLYIAKLIFRWNILKDVLFSLETLGRAVLAIFDWLPILFIGITCQNFSFVQSKSSILLY